MYSAVLSQASFTKARDYLEKLKNGISPGNYLKKALDSISVDCMSVERFLEVLVNTKKPQIFAESAVIGNGLDWNWDELSILGDLGIILPVTVYDNGQHRMPKVHKSPFKGNLMYIPGALLNSCGEEPADWSEVITDGEVDLHSYIELYERRLLPLLKFANMASHKNGKKAFITIPGLGCGQFAGPFRGQLGEYLRESIQCIIENNAKDLTNIKAVYYDPYMECENSRCEIEGITFLVRPLTRGDSGKSQLSELSIFNEMNDDFSNCELFSIVAWDHVSWPGNDFYSNSRVTDDGVKAAATDSMSIITGINGSYNQNRFKYLPPSNYNCWRDVVYQNNLKLKISDNLIVY